MRLSGESGAADALDQVDQNQGRQTRVAGPLDSGVAISAFRGRLLSGPGAVVILLLLGTVEGWMERTFFTTDAISYLDISRALGRQDWKMVFNPLWSAGYPFLIWIARHFFPSTPEGDWNAMHALNLVILLGAWAAFLYVLRSVPLAESGDRRRWLEAAGLFLFIAIQLSVDAVSRVGPDLLVSCLFFLATGLTVRLLQSPSAGRALALGCVLGAGYWVKGVFLAFSAVMLLLLAAGLLSRKKRVRYAVLAAGVFAAIAAPYASALSWSYGRFTLGEAGPLNYAFHVNLLPHWTNWQGGPLAIYGAPIHPTRLVQKNPDLFLFGTPYRNTYPPFGNIAYWYEGYHRFWSPKLQAIGILRNIYYLALAILKLPIFYAVAIALGLLWRGSGDRPGWRKSTIHLWPFFAPALLGIALYALVHLESRYLGSFFTILSILPFLSLCLLKNMPPVRIQVRALFILALGAAVNLAVADRQALLNLRHRALYTNDPQWKLGLYLRGAGLRPGQGVAAIGGPNASCTWAYMDGLRIVGELGGNPYDPHNPGKGQLSKGDAAVETFWRDSPSAQQRILSLFQSGGAVAVIAPGKPANVSVPGWKKAKGDAVWVYMFSQNHPQPPAATP